MRRGEIWWADFRPPMGRRPAVLVSRDQAYKVRSAVTVVPVTRSVRRIAVEVTLGPADGLRHESVANADDIITIRKTILKEYIATLSAEKLHALERAIRFALDL